MEILPRTSGTQTLSTENNNTQTTSPILIDNFGKSRKFVSSALSQTIVMRVNRKNQKTKFESGAGGGAGGLEATGSANLYNAWKSLCETPRPGHIEGPRRRIATRMARSSRFLLESEAAVRQRAHSGVQNS
jgi:hypothetical protein